MSKKIAINDCYGGFGLSKEACKYLNITSHFDISRDDPRLIECIEKLGNKINTSFSNIKIIEIPEDVDWEIEEYDGIEWVSEKHRTWEYEGD